MSSPPDPLCCEMMTWIDRWVTVCDEKDMKGRVKTVAWDGVQWWIGFIIWYDARRTLLEVPLNEVALVENED